MNVQFLVNRRADELQASTRAEILLSVGVTLFFAAFVFWRFSDARNPLLQLALAACVVWILATAWRFRHLLKPGRSQPPSGLAVSGIEHYRQELQRRRDHLRNQWLWHGPLLLSCLVLVLYLVPRALLTPGRLVNIAPFCIMLVVWVGFGIRQRRRRVRNIEREIEELP